jgi:hypothetical protein
MICQQLVGLFMILRQMAHSQTKRRTKMKNQNTLTKTLLFVICSLLIVFYSCDDGTGKGKEETPTVPQPTQKILSFGKVTISSPDEHLPSAWNGLCNDVVTAFNTAYANAEDTFDYDLVGNEGDGIQIVLKSDLEKNWEVKSGAKYGTLYIKTGSLLSITASSYETAMSAVGMNAPATSQN